MTAERDMERDIMRDIGGTPGHPGNGTSGHQPGVYIYDIPPDVPYGPRVPCRDIP